MIAEVDEDLSGAIDFAEFLHVIDAQKMRASKFSDEVDMIDAFVACGGNPDKSGHVMKETLVRIIKVDFQLQIDIEELIRVRCCQSVRWRFQSLTLHTQTGHR